MIPAPLAALFEEAHGLLICSSQKGKDGEWERATKLAEEARGLAQKIGAACQLKADRAKPKSARVARDVDVAVKHLGMKSEPVARKRSAARKAAGR